MEHHVEGLAHQRAELACQVAHARLDARVIAQRRVGGCSEIRQHHFADVPSIELATLEQGARKKRAEEAGTAGDEQPHVENPFPASGRTPWRWRQSRSQPSPSHVPLRGRYSQPMNPS